MAPDDDPLVTIPWPRKPGQTFPGRNNYWNEYIVQTLRDHRSEPGYKAWRAAVPGDFIFAVKGSRFITHMLKLRHFEVALARNNAAAAFELGFQFDDVFSASAALGAFLQLPHDDVT